MIFQPFQPLKEKILEAKIVWQTEASPVIGLREFCLLKLNNLDIIEMSVY